MLFNLFSRIIPWRQKLQEQEKTQNPFESKALWGESIRTTLVEENKFYLEISPRQTGKTYRLINAVLDWIYVADESRLAVIQVPSVQHGNFIRNAVPLVNYKRQFIVPEILFDKKIIIKTQEEHIIQSLRGRSEDWQLFVDEFDMVPKDQLIVDTNSYYVATPVKIRTLNHIQAWKDGRQQDKFLDILALAEKQKLPIQTFTNILNTNLQVDGFDGMVYPKVF